MKRVTFVFIGIIVVVVYTLFSNNSFEDNSDVSTIKTSTHKHKIKGIYN